jgi:hypothetical protein
MNTWPRKLKIDVARTRRSNIFESLKYIPFRKQIPATKTVLGWKLFEGEPLIWAGKTYFWCQKIINPNELKQKVLSKFLPNSLKPLKENEKKYLEKMQFYNRNQHFVLPTIANSQISLQKKNLNHPMLNKMQNSYFQFFFKKKEMNKDSENLLSRSIIFPNFFFFSELWLKKKRSLGYF